MPEQGTIAPPELPPQELSPFPYDAFPETIRLRLVTMDDPQGVVREQDVKLRDFFSLDRLASLGVPEDTVGSDGRPQSPLAHLAWEQITTAIVRGSVLPDDLKSEESRAAAIVRMMEKDPPIRLYDGPRRNVRTSWKISPETGKRMLHVPIGRQEGGVAKIFIKAFYTDEERGRSDAAYTRGEQARMQGPQDVYDAELEKLRHEKLGTKEFAVGIGIIGVCEPREEKPPYGFPYGPEKTYASLFIAYDEEYVREALENAMGDRGLVQEGYCKRAIQSGQVERTVIKQAATGIAQATADIHGDTTVRYPHVAVTRVSTGTWPIVVAGETYGQTTAVTGTGTFTNEDGAVYRKGFFLIPGVPKLIDDAHPLDTETGLACGPVQFQEKTFPTKDEVDATPAHTDTLADWDPKLIEGAKFLENITDEKWLFNSGEGRRSPLVEHAQYAIDQVVREGQIDLGNTQTPEYIEETVHSMVWDLGYEKPIKRNAEGGDLGPTDDPSTVRLSAEGHLTTLSPSDASYEKARNLVALSGKERVSCKVREGVSIIFQSGWRGDIEVRLGYGVDHMERIYRGMLSDPLRMRMAVAERDVSAGVVSAAYKDQVLQGGKDPGDNKERPQGGEVHVRDYEGSTRIFPFDEYTRLSEAHTAIVDGQKKVVIELKCDDRVVIRYPDGTIKSVSPNVVVMEPVLDQIQKERAGEKSNIPMETWLKGNNRQGHMVNAVVYRVVPKDSVTIEKKNNT